MRIPSPGSRFRVAKVALKLRLVCPSRSQASAARTDAACLTGKLHTLGGEGRPHWLAHRGPGLHRLNAGCLVGSKQSEVELPRDCAAR